MGLPQNLKNARIAAQYTQKELADLIGVKHNSISDWENARTEPNVDNISALCSILKISPDALLGISGGSMSEDARRVAICYRALDEHGQTVVKLVMDEETDRKTKEDAARAKSIDIAPEHETMRIYNQAAAAGLGCLLEDNSDIDYEEIEFLSDDIPYGTSFGIRIKGDSMEPTVPEGSIVWVKRQDEVEDGQIGVFVSATDGAICKRVRNDYSAPEGCITWFESINPKYPDMLPAEDTITGVVGRVLDAYTKGDK